MRKPFVDLECVRGEWRVPPARATRKEQFSAFVALLFIAVMLPLIGPH